MRQKRAACEKSTRLVVVCISLYAADITFFQITKFVPVGETMNEADWLIPVLAVTGAILLIGLIAGLLFYFDKKRRQQWLEVATALGFESLAIFPTELDGVVGSSPLLSTGRQRTWTNIYRRQVDSLGVVFGDYRYTVGQGKNTKVWYQTIILFHSPTFASPRFEIKPEGWFSRIGEMLGAQDIDFAEAPEFSKKYVLKSDDEAAVRDFLRPDILELLAGLQNLCLEVRSGTLMFWFDRRTIPPIEFKTAFEQAFSVYTAMSQPA
jgi:hypothetical protein